MCFPCTWAHPWKGRAAQMLRVRSIYHPHTVRDEPLHGPGVAEQRVRLVGRSAGLARGRCHSVATPRCIAAPEARAACSPFAVGASWTAFKPPVPGTHPASRGWHLPKNPYASLKRTAGAVPASDKMAPARASLLGTSTFPDARGSIDSGLHERPSGCDGDRHGVTRAGRPPVRQE
jgi:hypothetical protein